MTIRKRDLELLTLEAWERYAGPKSASQWVDGRSAKEVARAWLGAGAGKLPSEVGLALESHASFGRVLRWEAEPKGRLPFDAFAGEPRNSDLVSTPKTHTDRI
jgi:hypothetical protein